MEVRVLRKEDLLELQDFNNRIFPNKQISVDKYLNFWLGRNDESYNHCIVIKDEEGKIYGQVFSTEMSYYLNGTSVNSVWGFDLIVDQHLRKDNWGIDLLLKYIEMYPNACATGIGPQALPLQKAIGSKLLGEIRKYVGIVNPLLFVSSFFRGNIHNNKYPTDIKVNGKSYHKILREDLPKLSKPYNANLLEIARDKEFLQWRYFNDLHSYAFYKCEQSDDYFVVRTTILKHITVMLLVDYRCDMSNSDAMEDIYMAVKKIMQKLHIGMLIAGSTLDVVDKTLESHGCKSIGRPRPVMGIVRTKDFMKRIENRDFLFTTLADSDGETNWI